MGKRIWGDRPRVNFILKCPSERDHRRTFSVLRRTVITGQKPKHERVKDERISALNAALDRGALGIHQCRIQAELVVASMLEKEKSRLPRAVFNEENRAALEAYWEKEYEHRDQVDPEAAKNRLRRAVEAVGSLSLYTAKREKIQAAVNSKYPDHRQRAIVEALNQILRFLDRDFQLMKRRPVRKEVEHLKFHELEKAQQFVADPIDRLIQSVGFFTGLRQGEIFALTLESVQAASVFAQNQMGRDLALRGTKTREETRRRIYVLPGGLDTVLAWARLPTKIKKEWRNRKHAEILRAACMKAFPDQEEKHVTFHALRHSFAIYLASRGVGMTQIAQCLGNSVVVCEMYYLGFAPQNETIDYIDRVLKVAPVAKSVDARDLKSRVG